MEHFIYTRKIYTDEGYRVFVSYGVQWQSSQWQSHFKSNVALCLGWEWGVGVFGWQCHHRNQSRHWHTLVTEQRPVCQLTQQPNDKDASPSGFVMSGHTAPRCPSFIPHPPTHLSRMIKRDGNRKKVGLCTEHKVPSSVTNDQNTKVNTPSVI